MKKGLVVLIVATSILLCFISTVTAQVVIGTITVGMAPAGVGVDPSTNIIYVANMNDDTVSVIDSTGVDTDGDGLTDAEERVGWDIIFYTCEGRPDPLRPPPSRDLGSERS